MLSKLHNWWNAGEEGAILVYRARLLVPMVVLSAIIVFVYLVTIPHYHSTTWFFPLFWFACAIPVLLRRRRAVIFTPDVFLVRPAWGAILRIPISGIKRVNPVKYSPAEEYPIPAVHIELIVGGAVDVRLGVARPNDVISRLEAATNPRR
jgi:hypothetical protein